MFKVIWKPVISAIAYAFISFEDDYIIERSIAGFRQCATLAGHFRLPDVFDYVVVSLSQATALLSESLPTVIPNYPIVSVEGQSITVSTLSVKFGTNFRGQLAAVVLFNIVNGNGNALREGWTQVGRYILRYFFCLTKYSLDIRDVYNTFRPYPPPHKVTADGRFLGRHLHDPVTGNAAFKTYTKERWAVVRSFFVSFDPV